MYRGEHCFVILNTYPYTPGHVMIVPYEHLSELRKLPTPAAATVTNGKVYLGISRVKLLE